MNQRAWIPAVMVVAAVVIAPVRAPQSPRVLAEQYSTWTVAVSGGGVAAGSADSGNPTKVGGKYNSTPPTLDNGDRGDLELNASGYLKIDLAACASCTAGETAVTKDAAYTTTQTGAAVWTPASGKKIYVTAVDAQCGGTTAGTVRLWFGASGDTTYSAGTDQQLLYFNCATPSATVAPTKALAFAIPVTGLTADYILRATTSAGITVDVIVHGYER
jgi:hypothetical protein